MPRPTAFLLLALSLLLPPAAQGQVPLSPRSLGMGGGLLAGARGQEAIFLNPANLGLPDSPTWSVGLLQASFSLFTRGLPIRDVVDLALLQELEESERREVFSRVPESGLGLGYDVRSPLVGVQVGPIGVGLAYSTIGGHGFSRDLVELLLFGYESGRTDYSVRGSDGNRASFWDLAVAYGASTGPVSWGTTAHVLRGGTLVRSWLTDPRYNFVERDIDISYNGALVRGGWGMGLDLGMAYQPTPSLTLAGSVDNAIGRMTWSDDLRIRQLRLTEESLDGQPTDLITEYEQSERPVRQGDESILRGITTGVIQRDAHLPTIVKVGAAWRPLGGTQLVGSFSENLTDGSLSGEWPRTIAGGVEQRIPLLRLRAGFASDLDGGRLVSGGLSLGLMDLGVARLEDGSDVAGTRSGWIAVIGLASRTGSTRSMR
jgi:hypothetical protein